MPLQPKEIVKGPNFVDIDFYVPEPPLCLDTMTLQKARNCGFEIREDGVPKQIQDISVVSATKVRITASSDFGTGKIEVNYAGPSTSGNGNLCDSDNFISFGTYQNLIAKGTTDVERNRFKPKYEPRDQSGRIIYGKHYPMQNFSCAFYYALPAGQTSIKCIETNPKPKAVL